MSGGAGGTDAALASAAGEAAGPEAAHLLDLGVAGELEARYAAYRRRQAARLLDLAPPEAVRPLYRAALDAARLDVAGPEGDPLALLLRFCERLLPLPPMEVWRRDLLLHPEAHLQDLSETVHGPTSDAPATLATRTLTHGDRSWGVRLAAFHSPAGWRGRLVFEDPEGVSYRTTTIFHGEGPGELRDRFTAFGPESLRAFLRSALP